ncbi:hypothetical protein D1BOALGB6SA_9911 [Olavius sp. associated proteobacterium Delta 1]|nr:hypothetical protein D1BOALGB6SA_9911 [Olavius sp. associated proteobacterium Delta 1]
MRFIIEAHQNRIILIQGFIFEVNQEMCAAFSTNEKSSPVLSYRKDGQDHELNCDYISRFTQPCGKLRWATVHLKNIFTYKLSSK